MSTPSTNGSTPPGPTLVVDGAVKRYGDTVAVAGVSLELAGSEIVALVGPSGCGKSTLLRSIAGLVALDEGSITIDGVTVDDGHRRLPPEKRHVGLVFQEHSLFPHLSVIDNVTFGIRDTGRRDAARRAMEVLEVVELAGHRDRYPHELSGGERQRVALARALAPRPTLMLLDEPFASLDPNLRVQLRHHVVGALAATGTPAVFVTHDQVEALAVGDRLAVMRAGRIEQLGDPATVFHQPTNRFVGAFMGEASFLPVVDAAEGFRTVLGPVDRAPGGRCDAAMVRPDDVAFVADDDGDVVVTGAEFRGTTWSATLALADGATVIASLPHISPVTVGTRGRVEMVPGHRQIPITDER
ncbi:MAG: ABC transporter ATP-binding protein [Actinomycetota bacterium]|nr:ABC transporter ATP-binding protein [Actinomycetota bacterium]